MKKIMNNKKFKVGDKVLITKPKLDKENYSLDGIKWVSEMDDNIGKIFTLTKNQLLKLRDMFSCYAWRNSIYEILQDNAIQPDPFTIEQIYLNKAKNECTPVQLRILEEYGIVFEKEPEFKEGDFVVITEFDKTITVNLTIGKVYEIMRLNGECHFSIKKDDIGHSRTIDTKSLKFRHATEKEIKWKDFPADGTLCFVRNVNFDVWQLRYSDGKGEFYNLQNKSGNTCNTWDSWKIANCTLPE
jgi:hypothetical protein